jgi:hydrogenase nickel incorporation protein HypA/HybF
MHEMALAQSIVTMVAERARAEGACVVRRVGLAVGALGHVEPEALAFCLDSAALGSAIEGVTFDIATPPGRAYCFDCMGEVTIAARGRPCPDCGGHALRIAGGEELRVTHMEIE